MKPFTLEQVELRPVAPIPRIALSQAECALALGICERTVFEMTKRGEIPCYRRGKNKFYPVDQLRDWLARQVEANGFGQ